MTKANYSAWDLDPGAYDPTWADLQKLQFFARFAILAPSGHNTQPWHFGFTADTVTVIRDRGRALGYSGPAGAEPHVSLGACVETLRLAALGFGHLTTVAFGTSAEPTATVRLRNRTEPDASIPQAIVARVSNRNHYDPAPLPADQVDRVASNDLELAYVHLVTDEADIEFIARQTADATRRIMADAKFREELSQWVRNNLTRKFDGMPGFVQGIPTPPSMLARQLIKRVDVSKGQAKTDSTRISNSPAIALVVMREDSPAAMFEAGRLYGRIGVQAQREGLASSGIAASVIDERSRQEVVERFGLVGRPIGVLRIGVASQPARHTPRLPLSSVSDA